MGLVSEISRNVFLICLLLIVFDLLGVFNVVAVINYDLLLFLLIVSFVVFVSQSDSVSTFVKKRVKPTLMRFGASCAKHGMPWVSQSFDFVLKWFSIIFVKNLKTTLKYVFLVLLVLVGVSSFVDWFNSLWLTLLTILVGGIVFWQNRSVVDEVEVERSLEEKQEISRGKKFDKKYSKYNISYGFKKYFSKKEYGVLLGCVILSPFVLLWKVGYRFSKWLYKEKWYGVGVCVVFVIGVCNRFLNLLNFPLHQDENFAISVASGLQKVGSFVQYDFLNNAALEEYTRNKLYTFLVFLSNIVVQDIEFASRLPSVLFGLFGLFCFYFVLSRLFNNKSVTLVGMLLYSLNDLLIFYSRFARGYSFLIFIVPMMIYLFYRISKSKTFTSFAIYNVVFLICLFIAQDFSKTIFLIFPGYFVSLFLFFVKKIRLNSKLFWLSLAFLSLISLFVISELFSFTTITGYNLGVQFSFDFDILNPNTIFLDFLLLPFSLAATPIFSMLSIFLIVSVISMPILFKKSKSLTFILYATLLSSTLVLLYFATKTPNPRYVLVLIPTLLIVLSVFLGCFFNFYAHIIKGSKIVMLLVFFLCIIPFQFPGINIPFFSIESQPDWEDTEANRLHRRLVSPDLETAHNYLFENYQNFSIVVPTTNGIFWDRYYYLSKYVSMYNVSLDYYYSSDLHSDNFDKLYSTEDQNLYYNISLNQIISNSNVTFVIITNGINQPDSLVEIINLKCKDISHEINLVRFIYGKHDFGGNTFPMVFKC